jgi:hypothetical protein
LRRAPPNFLFLFRPDSLSDPSLVWTVQGGLLQTSTCFGMGSAWDCNEGARDTRTASRSAMAPPELCWRQDRTARPSQSRFTRPRESCRACSPCRQFRIGARWYPGPLSGWLMMISDCRMWRLRSGVPVVLRPEFPPSLFWTRFSISPRFWRKVTALVTNAGSRIWAS